MRLFDLFNKKTEPPQQDRGKAYIIINDRPYPLKKEVVEELLLLGAPVVWMNEKGELDF